MLRMLSNASDLSPKAQASSLLESSSLTLYAENDPPGDLPLQDKETSASVQSVIA